MPPPAKPTTKARATETALQHGLRTALKRTGRSARAVSLAAGYSESAIKNVLQGKSRSPRLDTITAIAREMGTSVEALRDTLAHAFAQSLPPRISITTGAPEHLRGQQAIGLSIFSGDRQVSAHITLTPAEARAAARQLLAEAKAAERHNKARED